jgi:hypothetical protein
MPLDLLGAPRDNENAATCSSHLTHAGTPTAGTSHQSPLAAEYEHDYECAYGLSSEPLPCARRSAPSIRRDWPAEAVPPALSSSACVWLGPHFSPIPRHAGLHRLKGLCLLRYAGPASSILRLRSA